MIADSSGDPDFADDFAEILTPPIQVVFDNTIYGIDWTGVVERRLVAIFGTTIQQGQIHLLVTDDLNRVWLDESGDLADYRQADGTIMIEDSAERIYSGVKTFHFEISITADGSLTPASTTVANFDLTVNQRSDFGYYMVIKLRVHFRLLQYQPAVQNHESSCRHNHGGIF